MGFKLIIDELVETLAQSIFPDEATLSAIRGSEVTFLHPFSSAHTFAQIHHTFELIRHDRTLLCLLPCP